MVAIEVTESQTDSDFLTMRDKMFELRNHGIKFYLDDFGTGYSNFERIMELPFDIVKFDRSLVIAVSESKQSEKMVSSLSQLFTNMGYSVLFEGVENELDEERCIKMAASYLQGYKYSKPIPIERLTEYFEREIA
jgi:EAL domain-containing protein (putative c-di-GMP-specific phosphodiesterase class I)